MASKFFKQEINLNKTLKSLSQSDSIVLEVADGVSFDDTQRALQAYASKLKIKLTTESLKAVSAADQVVRLVKIDHLGSR